MGKISIGRVTYILAKKLNLRHLKIVHQLCKKRSSIETDNIQLVILHTEDNFEQIVHPDIVKFNNKYFMVATPYPYSDAEFENPTIYCSDDCEGWDCIDSNLHPVARPLRGCHLSDPCLLVDGDKLVCYYRECRLDNKHKCVEEKIYMIESTDGIIWSNPVNINKYGALQCISPSVIKENNSYYMYFVRVENDEANLFVNVSDSYNFGNYCDRRLEVVNGPENKLLWHIYINKYAENTYHGIFTYSDNTSGVGSQIYYAQSQDGESWFVGKKMLLDDVNEDKVKMIYRSCMIDINDSWHMFASVLTNDYTWHIYKCKLEFS